MSIFVEVLCNPPPPPDGGLLQEAECGGQAEVMIGVGERVQLTTHYLLGENNTLPPDCTVSWRVNVKVPPRWHQKRMMSQMHSLFTVINNAFKAIEYIVIFKIHHCVGVWGKFYKSEALQS